jgi:hypothetical protein
MVNYQKIENIIQNKLYPLLERLPSSFQLSQLDERTWQLKHAQKTYRLNMVYLHSAEPRLVRSTIAALQHLPGIGVVVAPWFSETARGLLEQADCWYLDLLGNARIVFAGVFIERLGVPRPKAERRPLRSLWKPMSARVLEILLGAPFAEWNLLRLAQAARVSHTQTYKVKMALLAQEWVTESGKAKAKTFRLTAPKLLLKAWADAYQPLGKRTAWYTMRSREEIETILKTLEHPQVVLASYSAARLLAPYARHPNEFFYASDQALGVLQEKLELSAVDRGENIVIYLEPDAGVFLNAIQKTHLYCTSPIQTFLDLSKAGARGKEAAEHLFVRQIQVHWQQ